MSPDTKIKLAELSELSIGQLAAKYEKRNRHVRTMGIQLCLPHR
jgi:hypothetical protein